MYTKETDHSDQITQKHYLRSGCGVQLPEEQAEYIDGCYSSIQNRNCSLLEEKLVVHLCVLLQPSPRIRTKERKLREGRLWLLEGKLSNDVSSLPVK